MNNQFLSGRQGLRKAVVLVSVALFLRATPALVPRSPPDPDVHEYGILAKKPRQINPPELGRVSPVREVSIESLSFRLVCEPPKTSHHAKRIVRMASGIIDQGV